MFFEIKILDFSQHCRGHLRRIGGVFDFDDVGFFDRGDYQILCQSLSCFFNLRSLGRGRLPQVPASP